MKNGGIGRSSDELSFPLRAPSHIQTFGRIELTIRFKNLQGRLLREPKPCRLLTKEAIWQRTLAAGSGADR